MSAFVHPSAIVEEGAHLDDGVKVWHFAHVMPGASIGEGSQLGQGVYVGRDVNIGRGVKVQNHVSVYESVTLEDDVFCGPSMVFTNVINPRSFIERKHEFRETLVKKGATIGANATIVCGVTLGAYCLIGAGATVTKDVPNHALVVGVPSRQIGWACECGETLNEALNCDACSKRYMKGSEGLEEVRA